MKTLLDILPLTDGVQKPTKTQIFSAFCHFLPCLARGCSISAHHVLSILYHGNSYNGSQVEMQHKRLNMGNIAEHGQKLTLDGKPNLLTPFLKYSSLE